MQYKAWDEWTDCFHIPNVELPLAPLLGFSALTGDVYDAHEYVSSLPIVQDLSDVVMSPSLASSLSQPTQPFSPAPTLHATKSALPVPHRVALVVHSSGPSSNSPCSSVSASAHSTDTRVTLRGKAAVPPLRSVAQTALAGYMTQNDSNFTRFTSKYTVGTTRTSSGFVFILLSNIALFFSMDLRVMCCGVQRAKSGS